MALKKHIADLDNGDLFDFTPVDEKGSGDDHKEPHKEIRILRLIHEYGAYGLLAIFFLSIIILFYKGNEYQAKKEAEKAAAEAGGYFLWRVTLFNEAGDVIRVWETNERPSTSSGGVVYVNGARVVGTVIIERIH